MGASEVRRRPIAGLVSLVPEPLVRAVESGIRGARPADTDLRAGGAVVTFDAKCSGLVAAELAPVQTRRVAQNGGIAIVSNMCSIMSLTPDTLEGKSM